MSSCSPTRGSRGGVSLGTPHSLIGRQHIYKLHYIYIYIHLFARWCPARAGVEISTI